jgi:hypothetical protein
MLTSGSAKNIELTEININLEAIQVAAFKERKNILNYNRDFSAYDTIMIKGENFYRYFVVNVDKNNYTTVLKKIRKYYPSAFNARKKIEKILDNKLSKDVVIGTKELIQKKERNSDKKVHEKIEQQSQIIKEKDLQYNPNLRNLDSKTILQTRKKFF